MINLYHRLALLIYPWRFPLLGLSVTAFMACGLVLTEVISTNQAAFKPLFLVGIWLLLLVSVSYSFAQVPEKAQLDDGLIYRWKCNIKRFSCWAFAVFFTLISLVAILFSVKGLLLQS